MRDDLIRFLDSAFDRRSWHGTNLRGSIRGISVDAAAYRPSRGRHNAWELILHSAYWKYSVRRRLTGERRRGFPLAGSNWWLRPVDHSSVALRADIAILVNEHRLLRTAVLDCSEPTFLRRPSRARFTYGELVQGAAAHDLYHAGQIQLLKRLAEEASPVGL